MAAEKIPGGKQNKQEPETKETSGKIVLKNPKSKETKRVFEAPLLPIHDVIIFPYTLSPLVIDNPETIQTEVSLR